MQMNYFFLIENNFKYNKSIPTTEKGYSYFGDIKKMYYLYISIQHKINYFFSKLSIFHEIKDFHVKDA